jgi:hypothetical protein
MEDLPAIHANFAITSLKSIAEQQTLSTIYYVPYLECMVSIYVSISTPQSVHDEAVRPRHAANQEENGPIIHLICKPSITPRPGDNPFLGGEGRARSPDAVGFYYNSSVSD